MKEIAILGGNWKADKQIQGVTIEDGQLVNPVEIYMEEWMSTIKILSSIRKVAEVFLASW